MSSMLAAKSLRIAVLLLPALLTVLVLSAGARRAIAM
jgi:hypothetical protein